MTTSELTRDHETRPSPHRVKASDLRFNRHVGKPFELLASRGLAHKLAELEAFGYTVVEPEHVAPPEFIDQLRETVLKVAEQRRAAEGGAADDDPHGLRQATGQLLTYLVFEDPIFERALMNEVNLALITYLLGEDCCLSSMTSMIKGPGKVPLRLHADGTFIPQPLPAIGYVANSTYLLTDYTKENGALTVVPGSHRLCRQPTEDETANPDLQVTVEAPAGSLVVWHGNLWHGANARSNPGVRINLIMHFCRMFCKTQEAYKGNAPPEVLARNSERFARLMGDHFHYGYKAEGPNRTIASALGFGADARN